MNVYRAPQLRIILFALLLLVLYGTAPGLSSPLRPDSEHTLWITIDSTPPGADLFSASAEDGHQRMRRRFQLEQPMVQEAVGVDLRLVSGRHLPRRVAAGQQLRRQPRPHRGKTGLPERSRQHEARHAGQSRTGLEPQGKLAHGTGRDVESGTDRNEESD